MNKKKIEEKHFTAYIVEDDNYIRTSIIIDRFYLEEKINTNEATIKIRCKTAK